VAEPSWSSWFAGWRPTVWRLGSSWFSAGIRSSQCRRAPGVGLTYEEARRVIAEARGIALWMARFCGPRLAASDDRTRYTGFSWAILAL
jgi:hypothetical protein